MQYNISPETLLDERHPTASVDRILAEEINFELYKDNAVCPNGAMYRKDVRGFLPELMDKMYGDRVIFKKKMIQAKKDYEKTPTKTLEKEIARCNNIPVSYTHLRAHETLRYLVCRLLLEKKKERI